MENYEILKLLFETHHKQLEEKRKRVQDITERTILLLTVIAGWLISSDYSIKNEFKMIIIISLIIITVIAFYLIYINLGSYYKIFSVIKKINIAFGLYTKDKFIPDDSLYPKEWKNYGPKIKFGGLIAYWIIILLMSSICVAVVLSI